MSEKTCCPWSHGLRPKKLSLSVAVTPAPVRVPSQRPLAPSVASVTSVANDKGDNPSQLIFLLFPGDYLDIVLRGKGSIVHPY